ncbi:protein kinase domain-containing protein [Novipirellula sp. SH528]|uniref:protein kinase domain-containing protein n=1 Tax=Novipirellula sp. SH528 TaxID=3454466 RepID=UPI003FA14545
MNKTTQHCPDPSTLADWIEGAVSDEIAETVVAHVSECQTCNEWIERAEAEPRSLIALLRAGIGADTVNDTVDHLFARNRSPPLPLQPNDMPTHIGEFRIVREIGRGGMGVVYEAEQAALGRHVALKVLPPHSLQDDNRVRRFEREVQAAARLHHTNIVPVFGAGSDGDLHFYAMQYIQGCGLDRVITDTRDRQTQGTSGLETAFGAETDPAVNGNSDNSLFGTSNFAVTVAKCELPHQRFVAEIGAQVASALNHAHAYGVEHRDIKPANLILDEHGTVWVADFGLAKLDDGLELTGTGNILGTFRFMPPETFQGHSDPRSDIYSLGITLYELLTLAPAFASSDQRQLVHDITKSGPPPLTQVVDGVSRDLATIIHKAIAHDPQDRYHNAAELEQDLRSFVNDEPILARRPSMSEQLVRWGKRNRSLAVSLSAFAALLVIAFLATGWAAIHFRRMELSQRTLTTQRQTAFEQAEASRLDAVANLKQAKIGESDMQTILGLQAAEKGDLGESLLWYAKAAMIGDGSPRRLWANSIRFRTTLRQMPQPIVVSEPGSIQSMEELEFHRSADFFACHAFLDQHSDFIWNLASDNRFKFPPEIGNAYRVRWNPAGDLLAVANDANQLHLLAFPELNVLHQVDFASPVRHLKFTSDGKKLSIATGSSACLMSMSAPWSTIQCQPLDEQVLACVFDPTDTKWVVLGADQFGVIDISDLSATPSVSLRGRHQKRSLGGTIWPLFTTANEIVTLEIRTLAWYSLETNEKTRMLALRDKPYCFTLAPQTDDIYTFAFSGSHRITADDITPIGQEPYLAVAQIGSTVSLMTVGPRPTSRVWDSRNGKSRLGPIYNSVGSRLISFSTDGKKVAMANHDEQFGVWAWPGETPPAEITKFPRSSNYDHQRFSADGKHFLTTNRATQRVEIFDSSTGKQIGRSIHANGSILDAHFLGDGSRIVTYSKLTANSSIVEVWTWRDTIERVQAIELSHRAQNDLRGRCAIQPDRTGNYLAIILSDNAIGMLDLVEGNTLWTSALEMPLSIENFEYPDWLFVACQSNVNRNDKTFVRIDPLSGKKILAYRSSGHAIDFAVVLKRRVIVAGTTYGLKFYDLDTGRLLERPDIGLPNWVIAMTVSTSEDYLMVVTKDDLLRVFDTETFEQVSPTMEVGADPRCGMLSNDRIIVTYDDVGMVRFWDWRDGKSLGQSVLVPTKLLDQKSGGHWFCVNHDQRRMLIGGIPESILYDLDDFHSETFVEPEFAQRWAELVSQRSISGGISSLSAREWFDRWEASTDIRDYFRDHGEQAKTPQK